MADRVWSAWEAVLSASPLLSLIVATKGRASPLHDLFTSLAAQEFRDFEVIVVDQNADGRIGAPDAEGWPFPVLHLRTPQESGTSRARNSGMKHARGAVMLFPDDDCWYGPHFLEHALARMTALGADVLSGRAAADDGRDINGRFEQAVTRIDRATVWTTGIEWVVFFKREVLAAIGGYDPDIGVGASTPWQACEAQDIMLRALAAGYTCMFDPSIFGHHAELDIRSPDMRRKGRAYARGFGYVLRRHRFPMTQVANWLLRPAVRGGLAMLKGDWTQAEYCRNVFAGRLEGWRMKTAAPWPAQATTRASREIATG